MPTLSLSGISSSLPSNYSLKLINLPTNAFDAYSNVFFCPTLFPKAQVQAGISTPYLRLRRTAAYLFNETETGYAADN